MFFLICLKRFKKKHFLMIIFDGFCSIVVKGSKFIYFSIQFIIFFLQWDFSHFISMSAFMVVTIFWQWRQVYFSWYQSHWSWYFCNVFLFRNLSNFRKVVIKGNTNMKMMKVNNCMKMNKKKSWSKINLLDGVSDIVEENLTVCRKRQKRKPE